eukprot:93191_1
MASRVLTVASGGSQPNCQRLEGNAVKVLNEFYQPASFDCECAESKGGVKATTMYNISCKTHTSMRRNGIFGYIHWNGSFSMLGPTEEKACISYYSDECSLLDDKEIRYSFNYHQSKRWRGVRTKKSSPLMTCNVTVDGQVCSQCDVCDGRHTDQGIHYTAANCTNVPDMESLDYQCQDAVDTVKDIRDLVFKCPSEPTSTTPTTISSSASTVKPSQHSKSGKSSKKGSKVGKSSKGSKKV